MCAMYVHIQSLWHTFSWQIDQYRDINGRHWLHSAPPEYLQSLSDATISDMLVRSSVKKDSKPSVNPAASTESPQQPIDDSEGVAPPLKTGDDEMETADEPVKVEIEEVAECTMAPEECKEGDSSKSRGEILGSSEFLMYVVFRALT